MKVLQIRHMRRDVDGAWVYEGGGYICEVKEGAGIIVDELEGLLEDACESILITCTEATKAEIESLDEFTGW